MLLRRPRILIIISQKFEIDNGAGQTVAFQSLPSDFSPNDILHPVAFSQAYHAKTLRPNGVSNPLYKACILALEWSPQPTHPRRSSPPLATTLTNDPAFVLFPSFRTETFQLPCLPLLKPRLSMSCPTLSMKVHTKLASFGASLWLWFLIRLRRFACSQRFEGQGYKYRCCPRQTHQFLGRRVRL